MQNYHPDLLAKPVPRYTSYPTAAEFHEGIGSSDQAAALSTVTATTAVSLYVHIPYCQEICWYCGCNTGAIGRPARLGSYVEALGQEIEAVATLMRGQVVSIHFGGGSPNALPPHMFLALVRLMRARFDCAPDLKIAVELDPRAMDAGYADVLARAGVIRASLGVQTFAPHVQKRINRIQSHALVARAVADLRAVGIKAINVDLLYGLPGQSSRDIADTVAATIDMGPDRVAMFGYAHMPRLLPRQRMIEEDALPGLAERFAQSALAAERLISAGYLAIGFDHFAHPKDSLSVASKEGRLRRNFQGFTDEPASAIVGLGASAISQYDGLLVQNEKHVGRYRLRAANGGMAVARGVRRSDEDRLRAALIERLLCDGSVDIEHVASLFGRSADALSDVLPPLRELAARGLVEISGWRIEIPVEARAYGRVAASAFDQARSWQESPIVRHA